MRPGGNNVLVHSPIVLRSPAGGRYLIASSRDRAHVTTDGQSRPKRTVWGRRQLRGGAAECSRTAGAECGAG